jgi:hypothetical protein
MEQRAHVSVCSEITGNSMPTLMPSLLKYFLTVGALLFVGLIGLNAVLEPGGPGPRVVQDTPKSKLVRHDPRASLVERLREEEAAQKASGRAEANPVQPVTTTTSTAPAIAAPAQVAAPVRPTVTQAAAVAQPQPAKPVIQEPPVAPAQVAAQPPAAAADHQSAPAALTGAQTEDEARASRIAEEKATSEKARKKRAARERARTKAIEEASASRQQDRYYYGQRPAYAYAPPPRPVFGPFSQNQGGFFGGRGW